jgi:hypothetical protein
MRSGCLYLHALVRLVSNYRLPAGNFQGCAGSEGIRDLSRASMMPGGDSIMRFTAQFVPLSGEHEQHEGVQRFVWASTTP